MKMLINVPESVVPDALRGMALAHLGKSEKARGELAGKGMGADRPG